MAAKLQKISQLATEATGKLTYSIESWQGFLSSAAWLYKYPFHEQVLIHAQRPDARACAPIELWNKRFGRWVNGGARGIALLDDRGLRPSLNYVFDVSDTNARHGIPFRLWEMEEWLEERVLEELENHFGETSAYAGLPFSDQLMGVIHNAVADNLPDYENALVGSLAGSALEEYDEWNVRTWLEQMVEQSVGYCALTRLGYAVDEYFEGQDFAPVLDFNTLPVITQLGTATGDISQAILRQIERSVRQMERERTLAKRQEGVQNGEKERSEEHETHIFEKRGLLNLKTVYTYSLLIHCLQIPRRNQTIQKRSFCI